MLSFITWTNIEYYLFGKGMFTMRNDLSIVLCGQAGQGIQTVEYLLTRILKLAGYNVFATKEYMSRIRGGTNSTEIRISSGPVRLTRVLSNMLKKEFLLRQLSWRKKRA